MNNRIIYWIDNNENSPPSRKMVGGKAFNLIKLDKLGVSVPRGFIIKTSLFKSIIENIIGSDFHENNKLMNAKSIDHVRLKLINCSIPDQYQREILFNLKKSRNTILQSV